MKKLFCTLLPGLFFFSACESSKPITLTSSWFNLVQINPGTYKTIYIMGLFNNPTVSSILEYELAHESGARKFTAYRHHEVFPYTFDTPEKQKEQVLLKIKSLNCDAIFTSALIDVHSETHYVSTSSIGVGVAAPYPANHYESNFNSYYGYYYAETSLSGYYETNKLYFIESNLYDARTFELLWTVQSQSYNPSDIEEVSKAYCHELFHKLEEQKFFKGRRPQQ
jgi:hypothetical protein